jgi:hypothetical protein
MNWLALVALVWFSFLGFLMFLLVLSMNRNGPKKAAMLMARQAYIVEMSARMQEVSPQGTFFHTAGTLTLINDQKCDRKLRIHVQYEL